MEIRAFYVVIYKKHQIHKQTCVLKVLKSPPLCECKYEKIKPPPPKKFQSLYALIIENNHIIFYHY